MSSILCKVLDHIILNLHSNILQSSELQFGFKGGHSTVACNFVLQEVVQHFVSHDSKVYCLSLDATKAFDRVCYLNLFKLLIQKGACPLLVRFLFNMYTKQRIRVRWNNDVSPEYAISNGVKQGGVLSPVLFTVYIDELLLQLKQRGAGCHIGNSYAGALSYADDICLLSPSVIGIKNMMKTVNSFASDFHVQFNPNKSTLIIFGHQSSDATLKVSDHEVSAVPLAKHLGVFIGDNSTNRNVTNAISDLYARTNHLMQTFKHVPWRVKLFLFFTFCVHLYGCETWNLFSPCVNSYHIAFRKCIRRLLGLPYRTHNVLLPVIYSRNAIDVIIFHRILKFYSRLSVSKNSLIQSCVYSVNSISGSTLCNSLSTISAKFKTSRNYFVHMKPNEICALPETDDETLAISAAIHELLDCRESCSDTQNTFTKTDVESFLTGLCTL
jgi:hypothetical protein